MTDPAIIEAVEAALDLNVADITTWEIEHAALAIRAAVTPLIRAAALEEAAKLAEETARQQRLTTDYHAGARMAALSIAEDIRALKSEGRN